MMLMASEVQVDGKSLGKCVGKVWFWGSTVSTGITRESNKRDHLLYFLRACLPKSAGLCAQ